MEECDVRSLPLHFFCEQNPQPPNETVYFEQVIKRLKGSAGNHVVSNSDPRHISTISTPVSPSPSPSPLLTPSDVPPPALSKPNDSQPSPHPIIPPIVIRSDPDHPEQEPHPQEEPVPAQRPDVRRSTSFDDEARPELHVLTQPGQTEPARADMVSFVDLLFGGRLASMIVCESCKSVRRSFFLFSFSFFFLGVGLVNDWNWSVR